jgi:ABC-type transport system involved in cytochrome bd biosynthesis fused ATPase/permease subunit
MLKRRTLLLVLLLPLLASACIGESSEVSQAKAEYIRAKTRKIVAEAAGLEIQNANTIALQAQRLEQEHQSWLAAEARRANFENILVQTCRILAYVITIAVIIASLLRAASGAYRLWTKNRVELLQALEREAHAKTQVMKEERALHEAKARAFEAQRDMLQAGVEQQKQGRELLSRIKANGKNRSQQSVLTRIEDP